MKTLPFILLLLLIGTSTVNSQKNLLCIRVLLGDGTPAKALTINVHNPNDSLIASLTTDKDGNVDFRSDELIVNLDIRSKDLKYKSTSDRCYMLQNDTTHKIYVLHKRDKEEVEQLLSGQKKLDAKNKAKLGDFCPNLITGTEDTTKLKEVYTCLVSNINYPPEAQESGIEGKIYIRFVVDENGEILDLQIKKGSYAILEEEALRAAACLSGMTPATCEGKKVPTMYLLPLSFRLN